MSETDSGVVDTGVTPQDSSSATGNAGVSSSVNDTSASQAQSNDDSFFDANSLPEELKPAYKQMQAAYTKKTQEIAAQRKDYDALKSKVESYGKYDQYLPVVEEMLSAKPQQQNNPELAVLEQQLRSAGYSEEAVEMMKLGVQFTLSQFNQTQEMQRQQQTQQQQMQQQEAAIAEAEKLDPRLNDESLVYQLEDGSSTTFADIVAGVMNSNPTWRNDIIGSTKRAIQIVDAMINQAKTQGKDELSQAAKAKATKFSPTNSSPQGAVDSGKAVSMDDAYNMAKKQLGR